MRRRTTLSMTLAGCALAVGMSAAPAQAVPADKPQVLSSFTQTGAASYNAWNAARQNQAAWAAYEFDWSTDHCTQAPNNPFGFPFELSCARHDFGYRNYRAAGTFDANKARVDSAFYEDMKRVCAAYTGEKKTNCNSTAWTYYQAVKIFG
ncbi:phospholipase [Streptomyces sp. DSM 41921]|uniref:Phospholipase n=1 Tax=Streptomyces dubilierae TaxID=3075533 RepID=A0ABU2P6H7_9ACTN|nr:phospholipase [Streptomyces sp. DSM 41921]MDT0387752.1 phospholipase [Streptomyces sp. DSM 41921]